MTYVIKPERLKQIEESPSGWVPPATGTFSSLLINFEASVFLYHTFVCTLSLCKHSFKQRKAIGDIPVFIRTPKGDRNPNPKIFVGSLCKKEVRRVHFLFGTFAKFVWKIQVLSASLKKISEPPYSKKPSLGRVQIKNGTSPVALHSSVTITGGDVEKSCFTWWTHNLSLAFCSNFYPFCRVFLPVNYSSIRHLVCSLILSCTS